MEIQKSFLTTNGNTMSFSVPISKVDIENRRVYGWATLNNLDKGGDIVDSAASLEAFSTFKGNVREMHQNIAVGKVVNFTQQPYYDAATDKMYDGIFVEVYVSKGAPLTWEKVIDGTLQSFSIGGEVVEADNEYDPETEKLVRRIRRYALSELSLVDNGMNQLANITTVLKVHDGIAEGIAADVNIENVYWCPKDKKAFVSKSSNSCSLCGGSLVEIGWIEEQGIVEKSASVSTMIKKYLAAESAVETKKGGVDMAENDNVNDEAVVADTEPVDADEVVESAVEEVEEPVAESAPEVEAVAEAEVEEAASEEPVAEAEIAEPVLEEGFDFEAAFLALTQQMSVLAESVTGIAKQAEQTDVAVREVLSKFDAVDAELGDVKKSLGSVNERVIEVDKKTAIKKSADVADEQVTVRKTSVWGGRFFSTDQL